jgi:superfamily I DNA/RNA helicase
MQDERAIVLGAAGTGKTILAAEAAVRTIQEGKKVLLLTYSKNLAHYISAQVQGKVGELLRVTSIHELMVKTLEISPFNEELAAGLQAADEAFWHTWLPQHFALAQSEHSPICDVLIVDEGQDILTEHYLNAIDALVDGGLSRGRWLWCMDDTNQGAVYGRCDNQATQRLRSHGVSNRLRANIRNTRQIAEAAQKLAGPKLTAGAIVEGSVVTYYRVHDTKEARRRLLSVVKGLLDEGVEPGQITILSKHRNPSWGLEAVAAELPAIVWLDQAAARQLAERRVKAVSFSTISGFKGLENDFIIVTEVEDITSELGRALTYVAMTRARAKLIMLLSPEADAQRLRDAG